MVFLTCRVEIFFTYIGQYLCDLSVRATCLGGRDRLIRIIRTPPLSGSGVPRGGGLGGSNPLNSEGPPKSCQTQPDCENC